MCAIRILPLTLLITLLAVSCIKMPKFEGQPAEIEYSFTGGADMGKLFDFQATYTGENGETVTEKIPSLPWTRKIAVKLPFEANLSVGFAKGTTPLPDQEVYTVGFNGNVTCNTNLQTRTPSPRSIAPLVSPTPGQRQFSFSVTLPTTEMASRAQLTIPPLKYNKHFAFCYIADDAVEGAYAKAWRRINRKWIDDQEFFHMGAAPTTGYTPTNTLGYTDGCGNERRFPVGVSIWATNGNSYNPDGFIVDRTTSPYGIYITWEELKVITDFGGSVYYHNVNDRIYNKEDPDDIMRGFEDDYQKTFEKLDRKMKVMGLPDGSMYYQSAAMRYDRMVFWHGHTDSPSIYLKTSGDLTKQYTFGGDRSLYPSVKFHQLEEQRQADNPFLVILSTHRVDPVPEANTDPDPEGMTVIGMLEKINDTWGKDGDDALWFATMDEIYEYKAMAAGADIQRSVDGKTVRFDVTVPVRDDFYYTDLSFLMDGIGSLDGITVTSLSENIMGISRGINGGSLLVNVDFNPQTLALAEKYTGIYEQSGGASSEKEDALYFVSKLRDELAAPFESRIENTETNALVLERIVLNNGEKTTYEPLVTITPTVSGQTTHYRTGETADLSAAAWRAYTPTMNYSLSNGYGKKTVYFQVKNDRATSSVRSATINYAYAPSGTIPKSQIEAYIRKYDGYNATFGKKFDPVKK